MRFNIYPSVTLSSLLQTVFITFLDNKIILSLFTGFSIFFIRIQINVNFKHSHTLVNL